MELRVVERLASTVALREIAMLRVTRLHRLPLASSVWARWDGRGVVFTCDRPTFDEYWGRSYGPFGYSQLSLPGETFGEMADRLGFEMVRVDVVVEDSTLADDLEWNARPAAPPQQKGRPDAA